MGEEEEEDPEPMPDLKRCPVDQSWMAHNQNPTHVYHGCADCQSLWLPGTELEAIFADPPPELSTSTAPSSRTTSCPEGHGPLHPVLHRGAKFDQCPVCAGLWIRNDNLPSLKPLLQKEIRLKPPTQVDKDPEKARRDALRMMWDSLTHILNMLLVYFAIQHGIPFLADVLK